jgi:hypothetical protein
MEVGERVEGLRQVVPVRARVVQPCQHSAHLCGDAEVDHALEQQLLPYGVRLGRKKAHHEQAGGRIVRKRPWDSLRLVLGSEAQPGPFVGIA